MPTPTREHHRETQDVRSGRLMALGDVIVAIDGTRVTGANDLVAALAAHEPGDKVTVTVQRGSGRQQLDVTLAEQPRQASGG